MATLTLRRMGEGGINDQLGGGFCRYSVDEYWMIPHFEKMLYDNGALLAVYADAAVATGDHVLRAMSPAQTADWTLREMQSPEGGYYSSFDADSEGHEGKFYVWDREEVPAGADAGANTPRSRRTSDSTAQPNFEGHWHLHVFQSMDEIAASARVGQPESRVAARVRARASCWRIRDRRIWPGRDDKILTSWNALMIRGMAIAARALGSRRSGRVRHDSARLHPRHALARWHGCWRPTRTAAPI